MLRARGLLLAGTVLLVGAAQVLAQTHGEGCDAQLVFPAQELNLVAGAVVIGQRDARPVGRDVNAQRLDAVARKRRIVGLVPQKHVYAAESATRDTPQVKPVGLVSLLAECGTRGGLLPGHGFTPIESGP